MQQQRLRVLRSARAAARALLLATCALAAGAAAEPLIATSSTPPTVASATVSVDASRSLGAVGSRLFGANLDFKGNANGLLREDGTPFPQVISAIQALGITSLRGPGGSYADTYDWKNGVGPGRHHYGATYGFGTAELLSLLGQVGVDGLLVANFGSGAPALAAAWVQETRKTPGRVTSWEIGNEVYGIWETGHTTAADYASRFGPFAAAVRQADPAARVALVVAPTMRGGGQDYAGWNETVLPAAGAQADVASLHVYSPWHESVGDVSAATSLAVMAASEYWGKELARVRDAVRAVRGPSGKPLELWITEWNTFHGSSHDAMLKNVTVEEMVFVADMLRVFAEVGVDAAQFYNLMGPYWGLIDRAGATDDLRVVLAGGTPPRRAPEDFRLLVRPAAHVFDLHRPLRDGTRVAHDAASPRFSSPAYGSVSAQTDVPALRVLAVKEKGGSALSLVLVNRSLDIRLETRVTLAGWIGSREVQHLVLAGPLDADNEDGTGRVRPTAQPVRIGGDAVVVDLPPQSVSRLRFGSAASGALQLAP